MRSEATKSNESAQAAYSAKANDIARLIDLLQAELERHVEDAKEEPQNWGKVGDLSHVRGDLINLVAFMSGFEPAEIERHLSE